MQAQLKDSVLLVDDEPQVLVALEDLLSEEFVVLKTGSAGSALELLERQRDIAVVVTDQRMPKMTGDELLARMGDSSDATRILVTGFADLSAVVRAVNEGRIFAYVTKPWDAEDLRLKVHRAADHFRLSRELAHERQLLHDLMNSIPDGISFKDRDLRFLRANAAWSTMLDCEAPQSLVGKRLRELVSSADAESVEAEEKQVLLRERPMVDVVRQYGEGAQQKWISETKAPVRDPEGGVIGLVGIARDVTDRIITSEALRASEERLREQTRILNSILDNMAEGVVAVDLAAQILLFNQRAEQILGAGARDIPLSAWGEYGAFLSDQKTPLSMEHNPLVRAMRGDALEEEEIFISNDEVPGVCIAVAASPLRDSEDSVAGGIAVFRDVTQQRNLEQQLLQAQKMEAIGQLAGGVAHDFNNLLAVITSYGELMFDDLADGDSRREDLSELLGAARRAASLTRQLLLFSRRQVVQLGAADLNAVVSNFEQMLKRTIGENIDLQTKLSPSTCTVLVDPSQTEQILLNLTVNARDAMPDGGTLVIETCNVSIDPAHASSTGLPIAGEFVMLSVSDTGVGMDAATQKRVFEPFFTTKEVGRGTGLGLSTVYGIVQQCGGHIALDSKPGKGTSFSVYLPPGNTDGRTTPAPRSAAASSKVLATILLVEDDDAVRQVALRILRAQGHTVLVAARPNQARALCAEHAAKVDLLLTDVVMPETSGPKLAEEVRAMCPGLGVLYMSGYSGPALAHHDEIAGPVILLNKPFSPRSLLEKVQEALEQRSGRRER